MNSYAQGLTREPWKPERAYSSLMSSGVEFGGEGVNGKNINQGGYLNLDGNHGMAMRTMTSGTCLPSCQAASGI